MKLCFEYYSSRSTKIKTFLEILSKGIFKKNRLFIKNNDNETFFYWNEKNIFPYITSVIDNMSPYMCGEWSLEKGAIKKQSANKYRRSDLYCFYDGLGFIIETKRYWNKEQLSGLLQQIKDLELLKTSKKPSDKTIIVGILNIAGYDNRKGVHADYDKAYKKIISDALKIQKDISIQDLNISVAYEHLKDATDYSGKKINWGAIFYFVSTKLA